jgi:cytochrome c peroxidase
MPKNPENLFYLNLAYNPEGTRWIDYGLGGYLQTVQPEVAPQEMGKMKVPTLRNVDKRPSASFVKAYGRFKSLDDVVRFYASRGMMGRGMMGGGGMGGGGMGGGGRMCRGMTLAPGASTGVFPDPEVNQNLAILNMFRCGDQSYSEDFLPLAVLS